VNRVRVKSKIFVLTLLLIAVSMAFVGVGSSSTQDSIVSIEPALIWGPQPGETFTVDIDVDYVRRLWGYQLTMSFDPSILHGVSVADGPFLSSRRGKVVVVPGDGFDNEAGTLALFGAALYPIQRFPSGGGTLARVTFEVVGTGSCIITLGIETGLADQTGDWITHKEEDPEQFMDAYFINDVPGPELWIREKHGTFGGGAYPDWHVGAMGEEQTLYSKIANSGDVGAWVKVKFTVTWIEGSETTEYWSNEAEIPGVYIDPDTGEKVFPLVIVETDPFMPGAYGVHTVTASLYFKAGIITEYTPYELVEAGLGGLGTARDIATKFKVAE
jgi:hypothetical protein